MSEFDPSQPSKFDQLRQGVEHLFDHHRDMVTPYEYLPGEYNDRLSVVVHSPGRTVTSITDHPVELLDSLSPFVIDRRPMSYILYRDANADIAAAPTTAERRESEERQRRDSESIWLILEPNDMHVTHEFRRYGTFENRVVRHTRLDPNDLRMDLWLAVINQATPYNSVTHGILQHEKLPDGRRVGPDRIATHEEIAVYKRQVELQHMNPARRAAVQMLGWLGTRFGRRP